MNLHKNHFVLLRIAKLRALKVRTIGSGVYAVTSHTRRADNLEWVVTFPGLTCSCPAKGWCTHLSAAVDHHFINEAEPARYTEYTNALIEDRYQLRLRIRANELTRNDKIYVAYCERFYKAKLAAAKAVPPVTETVVRQGKRTRTFTRCGAFTI
jgi:hypothetical protein